MLVGSFVFLCAVFPVYAQETMQDAQLRDELRTILLTDPRTASLSESELQSMLNVLVEGVHEQGVANDYVLMPQPIVMSEGPAVEGIMSPWGTVIPPSILYVVVLVCLALAILLLWLLLRMHRKVHPLE